MRQPVYAVRFLSCRVRPVNRSLVSNMDLFFPSVTAPVCSRVSQDSQAWAPLPFREVQLPFLLTISYLPLATFSNLVIRRRKRILASIDVLWTMGFEFFIRFGMMEIEMVKMGARCCHPKPLKTVKNIQFRC